MTGSAGSHRDEVVAGLATLAVYAGIGFDDEHPAIKTMTVRAIRVVRNLRIITILSRGVTPHKHNHVLTTEGRTMFSEKTRKIIYSIAAALAAGIAALTGAEGIGVFGADSPAIRILTLIGAVIGVVVNMLASYNVGATPEQPADPTDTTGTVG
jgi:hypothetical protein